jgi:hypothetical protein
LSTNSCRTPSLSPLPDHPDRPENRADRRGKHGDERVRTADLLVANQMLSQLSYVPESIADFGLRISDWNAVASPPSSTSIVRDGPLGNAGSTQACRRSIRNPKSKIRNHMGLVGVEPTTSPLSGVRSNQLSYKPVSIVDLRLSIVE